jgi:hypothetical protein
MTVSLSLAAVSRGALNVQLTVAERYSEDRKNEPITSGVPLPEGYCKDTASLRLVDGNGNEVPCQFTPIVKWFRDGSIRWVLLDFQASVPAFSMKPFYLRDDGPAKPIDNPVQIDQSGDRIIVTTGPLKFAVRKKGFNLIDEAWVDESGDGAFDDAHRVVKSGGMSGPVLWSNAPNLPVYRAYAASADTDGTVTVEENGPMLVVIKAVGRHLPLSDAKPGEKLLDYVVRVYAYKGRSFVRVVYSAECRQGEGAHNFTPVDKWNVVIPGDLGKPEELKYSFGTSGADVSGGFGGQDRAWLVCESVDDWQVGGRPTTIPSAGSWKARR